MQLIVCGNTLGKYCFVGAGSVVTKNINDYSLVIGNPARHVGWLSEYGNKLIFNNENIAILKKASRNMFLEIT